LQDYYLAFFLLLKLFKLVLFDSDPKNPQVLQEQKPVTTRQVTRTF